MFKTILNYMTDLTPDIWVKYGGGVFIKNMDDALVFYFDSFTEIVDLAAYIEKNKRKHLLARRAVIRRISRHIKVENAAKLIRMLKLLFPKRFKTDEPRKPGMFYAVYAVDMAFKTIVTIVMDVMGRQLTQTEMFSKLPKELGEELFVDYDKLLVFVTSTVMRNRNSKCLCCGTPSLCYTCGAANAKFRCSQCLIISYCSVECQKAHWRLHKQLCDFCRYCALFYQCQRLLKEAIDN
ncbi:MAG: zinc finger MYND domain-containing protein [Desulfosporosinus sp.]|nr:zinc finger MYND domain-containing protein [Desulfosporosinus sp.]